jgi:hypothetical protein
MLLLLHVFNINGKLKKVGFLDFLLDFSWIFVRLLDWIELKKSNKKSKNPTFLDF